MRTARRVFSALIVAVLAAAPAASHAAPHADSGLTINATPNPNYIGNAVLIYGQLNGPGAADKPIRLYHRVGAAKHFKLIGHTHTDSLGFYEFERTEGAVLTNRSWFVRGPSGTHSRTVHERVTALVTLTASTASTTTNQPLQLTGTVSPTTAHAGEPVLLQTAIGETGRWRTIAQGITGAGSTFTLTHRFLTPGAYDLRATFAGDVRNVAASSDTVTAIVQQAEKPSFTIAAGSPTIELGQEATISGLLFRAGSTSVTKGESAVTLWGHEAGSPFTELASATTAADGSYEFSQVPVHNMFFQVRTATPSPRKTAPLFVGVADDIFLNASTANADIGQRVVFSGVVSPDKAGHVVYLQALGPDGRFHTLQSRFLTNASTFTFDWSFGSAGVATVRVRIAGGLQNVGAASSPLNETISLPSVTELPAA